MEHIHHPYFSDIKKPVLFIVDLPKELTRIFISGLETDTPMLPSSIKNHQADFNFILDGFYYFKDRKIYHSKRDTLFTNLNDLMCNILIPYLPEKEDRDKYKIIFVTLVILWHILPIVWLFSIIKVHLI